MMCGRQIVLMLSTNGRLRVRRRCCGGRLRKGEGGDSLELVMDGVSSGLLMNTKREAENTT